MNPETIGWISGGIVCFSIIPYAIRTYQGKVNPKLTSWSLWTIIGLALLLTYKSSGAEANLWPAIFSFANPLLIVILICKRGNWDRPSWLEKICIGFCLVSLFFWYILREQKDLVQYALYLAIVADGCAGIPTFVFLWKNPDKDRPFAWSFYALGYGLSALAVTTHTLANYVLILYMAGLAAIVAFLLARFRWQQKTPWREWV